MPRSDYYRLKPDLMNNKNGWETDSFSDHAKSSCGALPTVTPSERPP